MMALVDDHKVLWQESLELELMHNMHNSIMYLMLYVLV